MDIDPDDVRTLFDTAVGSLDFGSGMLDHSEVAALRRVAVLLGVDPREATPDNFRASFAHEVVRPLKKISFDVPFALQVRLGGKRVGAKVCQYCSLAPNDPVHHGVDLPAPQEDE